MPAAAPDEPMDDPDYTPEAFAAVCERYGFAPSDYGRPVDHGQDYLDLVGFNTRARTKPCVLRHSRTGRLYTASADYVHKQHSISGIEWPPR
jgi:hypothetical protein